MLPPFGLWLSSACAACDTKKALQRKQGIYITEFHNNMLQVFLQDVFLIFNYKIHVFLHDYF